jgi:hypothetical protein
MPDRLEAQDAAGASNRSAVNRLGWLFREFKSVCIVLEKV